MIGTVGLDLVCPISRIPQAGQTLFEENCRLFPGGKALVSAATFAEMGVEPIICSVVGEDHEGERILGFCKEMGLDTRFITTARDRRTAIRVMMTGNDGDRYTLRYQGSTDMLTNEQMEDAFTCLPDALYLQGELPEQQLLKAVEYARKQDIPVFFDPGDQTVVADYTKLSPFEIFTASEDEVKQLTGSKLWTQEDMMRACLQLAGKVTAKYYVLKLGERGSMLYDGTYYNFSSAYDVKPIDNCGVGDIYSAILVAEYMKTKNIRGAMEYANAGAALSVTRRGSIASIPHREQIARVVSDNTEEPS